MKYTGRARRAKTADANGEGSDSSSPKGPGLLSRLSQAGIRFVDQGSQSWYTPWSWADTRRVYHGDDGFWAYYELPASFLYENGSLFRELLAALASQQARRSLHLVQYSWSAPAALPKQTPEALAALLSGLTELHATLQQIVLGVKLQSSGQNTSGLVQSNISGLAEGLDSLLGETVPDFDGVDEDYQKVSALLAEFGAFPVTGEAVMHLESWYLLGANIDPTVTENETSVDFGSKSTLACLSIADLSESNQACQLPAPTPNSAICVSIRGKAEVGQLADASIVLARRSSANDSWFSAATAALTSGSVLSLPMRQLPALGETLPCSLERITPSGADLPVEKIPSLGITDPVSAGDRFGLSVGLAGSDYSDFGWWNPSSVPGQVAAICGAEGSGKTVLSEYLALQALTVGYCVRYLSGDGESGRPLVTLARNLVSPVASPTAGLANPGKLPHEAAVQTSCAKALNAIVPELAESVWKSMLSLPDPLDYNFALPLDQVVTFAPDHQASARIIRSLRESGALGMLMSATHFPTGSCALAMPKLLKEVPASARPATADLILANALLTPSTAPVLVIADEVAAGPVTKWAAQVCREEGRDVALVLVSRELDVLAVVAPDVRLATAEGDPARNRALLTWMGLQASDARQAWMRAAFVRTLANQIVTPPAVLLRDRQDRTAPVMVAPLPANLLAALTRGAADSYRP